jgi:hypothetical protein
MSGENIRLGNRLLSLALSPCCWLPVLVPYFNLHKPYLFLICSLLCFSLLTYLLPSLIL